MKHIRILISVLILALHLNASSADPVKEKSQAPNFKAKTISGRTVRLSDFKGKVVILDFGAVECPPCRLQMPVLESWHKKFAKRGLAVIGLMEMNPKRMAVKKMLKERNVSYPVAIDLKEAIGKRYGLLAHPTTILIDRNGKVVRVDTGYLKGDEKAMAAAFQPLLTSETKEVKR